MVSHQLVAEIPYRTYKQHESFIDGLAISYFVPGKNAVGVVASNIGDSQSIADHIGLPFLDIATNEQVRPPAKCDGCAVTTPTTSKEQ